jgi:2-amino-4-hydroxy-6-hydroxymethyldihydropteridine diphosphokinase
MAVPVNGLIAFIGIGSNLPDPQTNCDAAITHIAAIPECQVLRRASYYRTEPVGFLDQPWFINTVLELRTTLSARELMECLQGVENLMGRKKLAKWGPRIIDLDILLYGQEVINAPDFIVPHPELHRRRFVMEPLFEIAPYVIHPAFGISVAGLMQRLDDNSRVERSPTEPGGQ